MQLDLTRKAVPLITVERTTVMTKKVERSHKWLLDARFCLSCLVQSCSVNVPVNAKERSCLECLLGLARSTRGKDSTQNICAGKVLCQSAIVDAVPWLSDDELLAVAMTLNSGPGRTIESWRVPFL